MLSESKPNLEEPETGIEHQDQSQNFSSNGNNTVMVESYRVVNHDALSIIS